MTTTPTQATFDPAVYKRTTREQWQAAAAAWDGWGSTIETWLGGATERMLTLAAVGAGDHVLDVAAGAGGQTIRAARRVGPDGAVLATDIAPAILEYAAAAARREGLGNVATLELDGEELTLDDDSFDAVISRVGLIYLPDQHRALTESYRVLRSGGRVAAVVYSTPDRNAFFSVPVSIIRTRANLGPPAPGQPGPFSLGAPGTIENAFAQAGFVDVIAERLEAPLRMETAEACTRFERESFGALHQMLASLPQEEQAEVWSEIEQALAEFEGPEGFVGPCEMVVAVGTKP